MTTKVDREVDLCSDIQGDNRATSRGLDQENTGRGNRVT